MHCKKNISNNHPKPICSNCSSHEKDMYIKTVTDLKTYEQ